MDAPAEPRAPVLPPLETVLPQLRSSVQPPAWRSSIVAESGDTVDTGEAGPTAGDEPPAIPVEAPEPGDALASVDEEVEPRPAMPAGVYLATPDELADWDEHTVASPHGHVYQSRAWAEYRAAQGWQPWFLTFDDGFRLLVVTADHPARGGAWAYASRGPIPEDRPAASAARAAVVAELLADHGVDAFTVDGETPASWGLREHLRDRGFHATDEVQPTRHRMDVRLGPDDDFNSDEKTIFTSFGSTARNNIRQAERHGLRVRRLDAGGGRSDDDYDAMTQLEGFEDVSPADTTSSEAMLRTFHAMLEASAPRRGPAVAPEAAFVAWMTRALGAGHAFYLQAEHDEAGPVAGAVFYRHGKRLTYALAGDRPDLRRAHPGAARLLVWRGIQVALDERRRSVDLGGVEADGGRGKPGKGRPGYDTYQFKESFGARWVELTGAHQRTMRPLYRSVGTAASRAFGRLRSLGSRAR